MGPFTEGRLEWSGDNPGIYLRAQDDGPWVALALFFRVVVSPHGPGRIGLVVGDPDRPQGFPKARNLCITDNRQLSDYLVHDFVSVFPTFQGVVGLGGMTYLPMQSARTESSETRHSEFIAADGLDLELTWEDIGEAVAANIPPERSSTKKHRMYSVFRAAQSCRIVINGQRLSGHAVKRDFHGRSMTSALLAFSESCDIATGRRLMSVAPRRAHETALKNAAAAERHETRVRAWVVSTYKQAVEEAHAIDADPSPGPLAGKLIGIKDIIDAAGYPTRCGSPIYGTRSSPHDAASVALIRRASGIVVGKTATTEFAYFAPSRTTNPYNASCTPGGSSSGSAAAVATGMVEIALGTQTAASITRPASFCGVYGFKPSFGSYSLSGVKTLAHSLDTLGTFARSVSDIALMHSVLTRQQPHLPMPTKPRIGVCKTPAWPKATPDCIAALETACRTLKSAGAEITDVVLPREYDALSDMQMLIMAYDAARDLAYEDASFRIQLSPQICELIDQGRAIPDQEYANAQRSAVKARLSARALFDRCDIVLAPAAPGEAPIGLEATGDPIFNRMWTLLQLPTICIPGFEGARELPIGVQFLGPLYGDRRLLDHAAWIEAAFQDLKPRYRSAW